MLGIQILWWFIYSRYIFMNYLNENVSLNFIFSRYNFETLDEMIWRVVCYVHVFIIIVIDQQFNSAIIIILLYNLDCFP